MYIIVVYMNNILDLKILIFEYSMMYIYGQISGKNAIENRQGMASIIALI